MSIAISGLSGSTPQVWSGASVSAPPAQKMANLFQQIDSSGSGSITKAQFEQAFQTANPPRAVQQAGADAIWEKLDPSGSGSVSKQDFTSGMTSAMSQLRQHHHHGGGQAAASQASTLSASLDSLNTLAATPTATGSTIDTTA